jgi:hypothetical protein
MRMPIDMEFYLMAWLQKEVRAVADQVLLAM